MSQLACGRNSVPSPYFDDAKKSRRNPFESMMHRLTRRPHAKAGSAYFRYSDGESQITLIYRDDGRRQLSCIYSSGTA